MIDDLTWPLAIAAVALLAWDAARRLIASREIRLRESTIRVIGDQIGALEKRSETLADRVRAMDGQLSRIQSKENHQRTFQALTGARKRG